MYNQTQCMYGGLSEDRSATGAQWFHELQWYAEEEETFSRKNESYQEKKKLPPWKNKSPQEKMKPLQEGRNIHYSHYSVFLIVHN